MSLLHGHTSLWPGLHRGGRLLAAIVLSATLAGSAAAQAGAISGTVVEARTLNPLADAIVTVVGTTNQARTDGRGEFQLANVSGTVSLRVVRVGFQPVTRSASAGATDLVIQLTPTILKLDELVVTGTAGETQKRALGNAVGTVDLGSTQQVAPVQRVMEALAVSVPGLQVQRASGQIGTGGRTRIRGVGSLSLSAEPLVFIDGIRADNTANFTSAGFNGGADRPSRINDLDPNDIESIQVLKGPSASTLYGTEASNGVIQIITKRGKVGRPTWNAEFRGGGNYLPSPEKVYEGVYYRDAANPTGPPKFFNLIENDIARGFGSPFQTGVSLGGNLSVQGGSGDVRYFFSGGYDRDEGIVSYNWQNKLSTTANLTYEPNEQFKVDLNLGYNRSKVRAGSATQPLSTYLVWACPNSVCQPGTGLAPDEPGRGYLAGATAEAFEDIEGFDEIDRTRASLTFTHRPTSWLNHRLTAGGDFTSNPSSLLYPLGSTVFGLPGGLKNVNNNRTAFVTVDYSATASIDVSGSVNSQTSAGVQYYRKKYENIAAQGENFPIRGIDNVSGGAVRQGFEAANFNFENKTVGVYAQQQFGWKNRLFLTGAVRGDDNSAFGTDFDFVVYPKISAAWVISEEPFFQQGSLISTLKLRAAWGKAGQQPDVFAAVQTYGASSGGGGVGTVTPQNAGNANLKPEVGQELEFGLDASLLNDRVGLEVTYYDKVTKDGILSALVSPSSGFPGSQFVNVGQFSNRGIEIALDGTIISSRDFQFNLRGSLATNKNRIDDLGQKEPLVNAGIQQWNVTGFPVGAQFFKQVVSATLVQPGVVTDVMCEGGENFGNGDGSLVPCATAPRIFSGQPTPTWLSSFSADLTWKRFRLVGVAEFQGGHSFTDGNIAAAHVFFNNSLAAIERTDPILVAYQTAVASDFWATGFVKAGFGKLRNLSLTYDFPTSLARMLGAGRGSLTLTGVNLITLWRAESRKFGTRVVDSEIRSNGGTGNGTGGYNQEGWPQTTQLLAAIRLSF